jgi:glycine/D-amino acid oxidase-like deaminating enzyme
VSDRTDLDLLIVGHGVAGAVLAWAAQRRGWRIRVVDAGGHDAASAVGAGLYTPLTGQRLALTWNAAELLPLARTTYDALQEDCGAPLHHRRPTLRLLEPGPEAARWAERARRPELLAHARPPQPGELDPFPVDPGAGAAVIEGSGWVDLPTLLARRRAALATDGNWEDGTFRWTEAQETAEAVCWRRWRARRVVFCEGYRAAENPLLAGLTFRNARGDVLDVDIPGFPTTHVVNRGVFVLPLGGARFRVGATFDWTDPTPEPRAAGRREIEDRLCAWLRAPFTVVDHRAGVRPVCRQTWPVCGPLPGRPRVGVITGFGAKGVLYAPYAARVLLDHLEHGAPLPPEVDPARRGA